MFQSQVLAFVMTSLVLTASLAAAQPSSPDSADARFSFHRADDGYLRLDGRTGQVSMCHRRGTGWQCQVVPDERAALETEIARLQSDNAVLKKHLLSRNLPLPDGMRPEPTAPKTVQPLQLPSDADLDRVMGFMEKLWRRLVEMIASVQRDLQKLI
jgi:hypothetical protein